MNASRNKRFSGSLIRKDQYQFRKDKIYLLFVLVGTAPLLTFLPLPAVVELILSSCAFFLIIYLFIQFITNLRGSNLGTIELDSDTIYLYTAKEIEPETIKLDQVHAIEVQPEYDMPRNTMRKEWLEILGKRLPNLLGIKISEHGESKNLYFQPDSYYQLKKLTDLIREWKRSNYPVTISDSRSEH